MVIFQYPLRYPKFSLTPHEGIADKDAAQGLAEAQTVISPVNELLNELLNELDCAVPVGVVELLEKFKSLELLEILDVEELVDDRDDVEVGDVSVTKLPGETEDVDV
jgi:hypothetical protein